MSPGGHGGPSRGILSRPEGQGLVLGPVGESEYPGLFWASYTRFEVEVEFEVLIQVELWILPLTLDSQTTSTSSPQPFLHAEPQKPSSTVT